jgi:hypothetical protein
MKRLIIALKVMLVAFLIPCAVMASLYALSQTNPPKIAIPVLNDAMKLNPIWHNLPTAYRNQHRLVIAGLPIALLLAASAMIINPTNTRTVKTFILGSTIVTAIAANWLDCSWLFRMRPEWIEQQTAIRSIPWVILGVISLWISTRIQKPNKALHPYAPQVARG